MWITFFGSLTLGFLLVDEEELPYFMWGNSFKVGLIVFFLFFLIFLRFTLLRLKRVELSETHIYISNYFKTYRYPFSDIECIKVSDLLLFKLAKVEFTAKTSFGRNVYFLLQSHYLADYIEKFPGTVGNKVIDN